jgi:hypothetical protein
VMAHPAYQENPIAAIRRHLEATVKVLPTPRHLLFPQPYKKHGASMRVTTHKHDAWCMIRRQDTVNKPQGTT